MAFNTAHVVMMILGVVATIMEYVSYRYCTLWFSDQPSVKNPRFDNVCTSSTIFMHVVLVVFVMLVVNKAYCVLARNAEIDRYGRVFDQLDDNDDEDSYLDDEQNVVDLTDDGGVVYYGSFPAPPETVHSPFYPRESGFVELFHNRMGFTAMEEYLMLLDEISAFTGNTFDQVEPTATVPEVASGLPDDKGDSTASSDAVFIDGTSDTVLFAPTNTAASAPTSSVDTDCAITDDKLPVEANSVNGNAKLPPAESIVFPNLELNLSYEDYVKLCNVTGILPTTESHRRYNRELNGLRCESVMDDHRNDTA